MISSLFRTELGLLKDEDPTKDYHFFRKILKYKHKNKQK